jgi:imidazole glycerol phosphate synthase glutamine amidotransferase subunit
MVVVGIVDYGASNLLSVKKALNYLGVKCKIVGTGDMPRVDKLVLPGVGAFRSAVEKLNSSGLYDRVEGWLLSDRPFLGICLGMQLLFERSDEAKEAEGFAVFRGENRRFREGKIPQIGWNQVHIVKKSKLMDGIDDGEYFYFLHSYYVQTPQEDIVVGRTDYGVGYPSIVEGGNICAVQFHPEKSGAAGLKLLDNWVKDVSH